jgi:long-chain acyl-CoA synthetase
MTSGSTGNPKPIIFSQKNKILRGIKACAELYNVKDNDVIITASPMYHSLGQRLALFPLIIGATTVIVKKFMPELWLKTVENYKVTFTIAVSSHLESILRELKQGEYDISSLKTIVSSSSLLKNEAKQECIKYFNCDFHECYGTSEVGIVTNLYPEDTNIKLKSVGRPLPFVDMKIVDDSRRQLPPGEVGEIICSTPTLFSGYYKLPEKTAESVVDGYFYTGDLGKVDDDGYLYFCGRKKELIIVGGTNVYPGDVEEIINACSEVAECAVIGVEDSYFGEAVLAVIVPAVGENPEKAVRAARKACASSLADYQQPMAYEVLSSLPKNALGKLMKHKLLEQFKGYDATAKFRALRGIK